MEESTSVVCTGTTVLGATSNAASDVVIQTASVVRVGLVSDVVITRVSVAV